MTIYLPDFNNNMCTNETEEVVRETCTPVKAEYSENYDSDSEPLNGFVKEKEDSRSSSIRECKPSEDQAKSSSVIRRAEKKSRSKRAKPPIASFKTSMGKKAVVSNMNAQMSAVDRWEAAQIALAEANSQNVLLQRQLQDCRLELRTVQRQCKMQSARLNRAIGQEADLPQIVDRLTADIRAMQIRLREKTAQFDASQRRVSELQHRIYVLEKERDEHQAMASSEDALQRRSTTRLDEVLNELQAEKKKSAMLSHQLDVASRSHKHQIGLAHEQIRQLRRNCRDLENQLNERTQMLQEKIKLLELQNIYSLRLPKHVPTHLPPTESNRHLTPDAQDPVGAPAPALPKPQLHSRGRIAEANTPKISVNLGRPRGKRATSRDAPTRPDAESQCAQQTHIVHPGTEMLYSLLVDPSTCESMVDAYSALEDTSAHSKPLQPSTGEDRKSTKKLNSESTSNTTELHAAADPAGFHGDVSATLSTVTRDDLTMIPSSTDKSSSQSGENFANKSVRPDEWHIHLAHLSFNNEEVSMIASQQDRPVDVTLITQDANTTGASQTTSVLLSRQEEVHERERKARLLKTLDALDQGRPVQEKLAPDIGRAPLPKLPPDDDTSVATMAQDHSDFSEDFAKLNKKREEQLWNELFGPETATSSYQNSSTVHRGHAGLMAKVTHSDTSGNNNRNQQANEQFRGTNPSLLTAVESQSQSRPFKSPADFIEPQSVNASVKPHSTIHRPAPPRGSGIHGAFDDQEVDSEFEEFHI